MAEAEIIKIAAYAAAGLCMGIGTLGPALGQGMIGSKACESIGKKPESQKAVFNSMMLALAFVESATIYALIISLLLVLK